MADTALLTQLAMTVAAVAVLVGFAAWAKLAKPQSPLNEAQARALLEFEFPGRVIEAVWVTRDGKGAVGKSGAAALVLCRLGEGWTARKLPWTQALCQGVQRGQICIDLSDVAAQKMVLALQG